MSIHPVGLSLGRVEHWHDGLGEYGRRLVGELAARATELRRAHGIELYVHLPARWHGMFGDDVHYLGSHTTQRLPPSADDAIRVVASIASVHPFAATAGYRPPRRDRARSELSTPNEVPSASATAGDCAHACTAAQVSS